MFPDHTPGVALLILRFCIAGLVTSSLLEMDFGIPLTVRLILATFVVAFLCLGLFTPLLCLVGVLLQALSLDTASVEVVIRTGLHIALTLCLLLLGPGAYSIDARRYGRRRISPPAF